jgi:hypothetical protein
VYCLLETQSSQRSVRQRLSHGRQRRGKDDIGNPTSQGTDDEEIEEDRKDHNGQHESRGPLPFALMEEINHGYVWEWMSSLMQRWKT